MQNRKGKTHKDPAGKSAHSRVVPVPEDLAIGTRFKSSFDHIAVGIAYTTIEGRILGVNHKLCEMLGYTAAELIGTPTRDLTHPDDRDQQDNLRLELLAGTRSHFSGDKRYVHKNGSDFWVSRTVAIARESPDSEPYLIQTIDSINKRKHAELNLQRLNRAWHVATECTHILFHASDEITMLSSVARVVVESGGYKQAWIGKPSGDPAHPVQIVAFAGYGNDTPMSAQGAWARRNNYPGAATTALTTGKMHILRDILHDPQHIVVRNRALGLGYQSSAALPLMGDGRILAVMVLHAAERDAFDEEEIRLLDELSGDIGFGIASLQARAAREQAEQQSRENEKRFREIFEQAAVGITRADLSGVIIDCNQKFSDMLGYTREALLGKSIRDITHPDDYGLGAQYRAQLATGANSSRTSEKRFIRKDGTPVWTRRTMSTACDAAGKPQYVISVIEDITGQKELEQHHRETFDQAAVGIVHTSLDGHYLRVNRQFCKMLGYSEAELLGRAAADFSVANTHNNDAKNRQLMWKGKLANLIEEKQYLCKDGSILWANRTVSLARDASGKPLYFIRVIEDITSRKEADARYRAAFNNAPIGIMHTAIGSYKSCTSTPNCARCSAIPKMNCWA